LSGEVELTGRNRDALMWSAAMPAHALDSLGRTARSVARTAVRAAGFAVELHTQTRQGQHIAVRRRKFGPPLCKARVGLADIERGRQRSNHELVAIGEATIMSAVVAADRDDAVHNYITARVVGLSRGIDPITSPLVSTEMARKVILGFFR
jgi:hypothetical protein